MHAEGQGAQGASVASMVEGQAAARTITTAGLPPNADSWIWPWWLQRQLDPRSAAWIAGEAALVNSTGRNWTLLGVPDRSERWVVDARGLLSPAGATWGIDWMLGAPDRWHVPARSGSVRQRLVGSAPVVETVVSVDGGEVVHRCWAEPAADGAVARVEVRNGGSGALALAMCLRPYGPAGLGSVTRVEVSELGLLAGGAVALGAAEPARHGVARGGEEDSAGVVVSGGAGGPPRAVATSPGGWATASLVWALAGRESIELLVPGLPVRGSPGTKAGFGGRRGHLAGGGDRGRRRVAGALPPSPGADRVAAGWAVRARSAARLDLPAGRLCDAIRTVHACLPLAAPDESVPRRLAAARVRALVSAGWLDEAGAVLESWLAAPGRGGRLGRDAVDTAETLVALRCWARASGSRLPPGALGVVGRAAEHVARRARRLPEGGAGARRLSLGLRAGGWLLEAGGEPGAARQVERWRAELSERWPGERCREERSPGERSPGERWLLEETGLARAPAGPSVWPPGSSATHRGAGSSATDRGAGSSVDAEGLVTMDAVEAAVAAIGAGGDPTGPLRWLLGVASPTWTWPGVIDPRLGTGSGGDGADQDVAAGVWRAARELLVGDEDGPDGSVRPAASPGSTARSTAAAPGERIALLRWWPPEWTGEALEVHGLPTAAGRLGFALRWHGRRPALLWELVGAGPAVSVSAPGLDPSWSALGRRGEALLADPAQR